MSLFTIPLCCARNIFVHFNNNDLKALVSKLPLSPLMSLLRSLIGDNSFWLNRIQLTFHVPESLFTRNVHWASMYTRIQDFNGYRVDYVEAVIRIANGWETRRHELIYACCNCDVELVKLLLDNRNAATLFEFPEEMAIDPEVAKLFLECPEFKPGMLVVHACVGGYITLLKVLLQDPRIDPSIANNRALKFACRDENIEMASLLFADSRVNLDDCMILAIDNRAHQIVELLLDHSRVDLAVNGHRYLLYAVSQMATNIVTLLLNDSHIDPVAECNRALRLAIARIDHEMVDLLMGDARIADYYRSINQ